MCHPTELRVLTVGEMAAVQEFPPDWQFSGNPVDKCRQVGNAVPPRLGKITGEVIAELIDAIKTRSYSSDKLIPSTIQHIRPHVRTKSYYRNGKALAGNHCYYQSKIGDDLDQLPLFEEQESS